MTRKRSRPTRTWIAFVRSIAENHLKELFEEPGDPRKIEDFATPHPTPYVSAADALCPRSETRLSKTRLVRAGTVVKRTLGRLSNGPTTNRPSQDPGSGLSQLKLLADAGFFPDRPDLIA